MTSVEALSIPERYCTILRSNSINTVEDLISYCKREILFLHRIGPRACDVIENALEEEGFELAPDEYAPYTCARHGQPRGDVSLTSLFLCESCKRDFQINAFRGKTPEWVSEPIEGYCLYCNQQRDDIKIYQWYLCAICARVVKSIGRSVAANNYLLAWWNRHIQPQFPHLHLELVDDPELRPYDPNEAHNGPSQVDFICTDQNTGEPVFGIELKTGRGNVGGSSIGTKMARFQLDNSDCDAIMEVAQREGFPVYLAHAQVIDRNSPPTTYYVAVGLWWTDPFSMQENFEVSRQRPRENRPAAYFKTGMFYDTPALITHLQNDGPTQIKERIEREGHPALYR